MLKRLADRGQHLRGDRVVAPGLFGKGLVVLGAEIGRVARQPRILGVVDLIIEGPDVPGPLVGGRDEAALEERHRPEAVVAVAAGLDLDGHRDELEPPAEARPEEVSQRHFDGRSGFVIPEKAENEKPPVSGCRQPDVIDRPGPIHFRQCECLPRPEIKTG